MSTIDVPLVSKSLLNCVTYVTLRTLHGIFRVTAGASILKQALQVEALYAEL